MRGRFRNIGRQQGQLDLPFRVSNFQGGENSDLPATEIGAEDFPLFQDMVAFPEWCEGRGGSQKFSATALPGSGTIHAFKQHPTSKKFVLYRGTQIWSADSAQAAWTEVTSYAGNYLTPTFAGDASNQLSGPVLNFVSTSNTNAGILYWNLTNSGVTRTLNIYKDAAKTSLVGKATRANNGLCNILPQNNSGLAGYVTITYTIDDTDSGNTVTLITPSASFGINLAATLRPFDNNMILFVARSSVGSGGSMILINLTDTKFYSLNNNGPVNAIIGSGSQSSTTPYGYDYLMTYSRITNTSGAFDSTVNRVNGILIAESGSTNPFVNGVWTDKLKDYGEFWLANPISGTNSNAFNLTLSGAVPGSALIAVDANGLTVASYTHISIYRTLDIGVSGIDPVTGSGNNSAIFIWVGDYPIGTETITDTKTDAALRVNLLSGTILKSRFLVPIPDGEIGEVAGSFLYAGTRGDNTVNYGQIANKIYAGLYQNTSQFFKLNDGLQVIAKSPDMMTFVCNNKTYISSPNSYFDAGSKATGSIFILNHLTAADESLGVMDYGSFTNIESGVFIAHCSDHSIRVWNGSKWGPDISSRKVNKLVRQMLIGSAGGYFAGAYYIWYRTDSTQTYNNLCLRYGFGRDNGFGWSRYTGTSWVYAPLNCGAELIQDANSIQRLLILDAVDALFYWIETFTGYTGSGLTKVYLDKVAVDGTGGTNITPKIKLREIIGASLVKRKIVPDESQTVYIEEVHAFLRSYNETLGFLSGFQINMVAYVDGSATATETVSNLINKGDWQFWQLIEGKRIQLELNFTTSGFILVSVEADYQSQNKQTIGKGPSYTDAATAQKNLASNLKHWLTRPSNLLNRATGTNYTLAGTAPTNVTGPDGRTFALSFVSGASYTQADTNSYGDFAVAFWCKTVALNKKIFQITGTNSFYVQFTANTTLDINGAGNVTVTTIASGWHHFVIVRVGSTVSVYQNGALNGTTVTVATARGGTSFDINPGGGAMLLYDIRAYNASLVAADDTYLYNDTSSTTLAGNKVLPLA